MTRNSDHKPLKLLTSTKIIYRIIDLRNTKALAKKTEIQSLTEEVAEVEMGTIMVAKEVETGIGKKMEC